MAAPNKRNTISLLGLGRGQRVEDNDVEPAPTRGTFEIREALVVRMGEQLDC